MSIAVHEAIDTFDDDFHLAQVFSLAARKERNRALALSEKFADDIDQFDEPEQLEYISNLLTENRDALLELLADRPYGSDRPDLHVV